MSSVTRADDRPIQTKAFNEVTKLLQTFSECLVKMFCGTGKSRIIKRLVIEQKKSLSVIVFPSLALIRQFTKEYLGDIDTKAYGLMNVSSEELADIQSTTDPAQIRLFITNPKTKKQKKIICVTYQSLAVLLNSLGDTKIGIACFDEAHHTTSPEAKELVYVDEYRAKYEKRVFFTATPLNANGVTMFDRERNEMGTYGDCGPLACEYTYLQGLRAGELSLFELRADLYTQDTVANIYESIARAILTTGNTRVLTFHAKVDEDNESETSVLRFVDKAKFIEAFRAVCAKEFPDKVGKFPDSKITFTAITADTKKKDDILGAFDKCTDDKIYIVSSCRTIGEGVDTKKANMCVFVDPKTSVISIIQNIGRICRKVDGTNRQPATILVPVCIGWEKYKTAGDDAEKQDKLIREQLNDRDNGDYNAIMNIVAALKQEDPELYELCLRYPSNFTESERKHALEEQKREYDLENYVNSEEIDELVENGERVEIHTSNTEQPIVYRGFDHEDYERPIQRFYEIEEENEDGEMETRYHPIVPMNGEEEDEDESHKRLSPPKTTNRPRMNIHTNDEIKLLWRMGDVVLGEQFGSAVLECEMERVDTIERWKENHQKMCEFIDDNGRAMNQRAKDSKEKIIGRWTCNQKTSYNPNGSEFSKHIMKKNKEIWKIWTDTLADPKYKEHLVVDRIESWKIKHTEMCEFIDFNKKTPSHSSADENEKMLARWIGTQKKTYDENGPESSKCIMKTNPEIWTIWNDTLADPKYKEHLVVDRIESWKIKHTKMCKYITQTGKSPCCSSKDATTKKLAHWVSDQKKFYNPEGLDQSVGVMKISEIWKIWTDTLTDPHYNSLNRKIAKKTSDCPIQHWKNMFESVCLYIEKNKRAPPHSSKCKTEKSMEGWIHRQKESFDSNGSEFSNNIMKNAPEVWETWRDALMNPKYKDALTSKTRNELNDVWKTNLLELCKFISSNKKYPSNSSKKGTSEKSLAYWIGTQRKNYEATGAKFSKHIMKTNPEIWQIWTDTVQKYPCLKKKEQETPPPSPSPPPQETPKLKLVFKKKSHLIPNPSLECSTPETTPETSSKRVITDSEYKLTGRMWSKQNSTTTHEKLQSDPTEWYAYHTARDISFQGYDQSQIPRNRIIAHLATKRKDKKFRILDLGCGRNNIAHHFAHVNKDHKFTIQGYDHVIEEGSGARIGNIADLAAQEEDESADICIYSQSLMGKDWRNYLTEGYRMLRSGGQFIISEHIKMLDDICAELVRLGCKVEMENTDSVDGDDKVSKWFVLVARVG